MSTRLLWVTVTGPLAWCGVEGCNWDGHHGDSDHDNRPALAAAKAHAKATGHEVIVERGQTLRVMP